MRLIKKINGIVKYQRVIVLAVAGAYSGAVLVGKMFCKVDEKIAQESTPKYCFSNPPFCHGPQEASIPLTYVSATTSTATLAVSALSFADSENFNFPIV